MEKLIMGFKKWFRGALDSDPEVEQKEVDLAQAIIDLHHRDPVTGKVKDMADDADKVAELKVLVKGLEEKLPPEDMQKLLAVIASMAESKAADGEPEEGEKMENVHADAMKAAGCDAESPEEVKAFAEGVKYGEELEKNPAERAKLDREHESEGMKKAMDKCGVDAEDPAETKAFAEGVKYGEEHVKAEAEDEDEDPKAEDEDKDGMIEKILAAVPELTDEQKEKIADTLSDLAYSPATGDEEKIEAAADRAIRKRRFLGATDAARIRAQATADAMNRMRGIAEAVYRVRPLVGEMDALAFDSANDVYGYALEQMGKNPRRYDRKAWHGMVDMLLDGHSSMQREAAVLARDSKSIPDDGPFRFLKNISVAE